MKEGPVLVVGPRIVYFLIPYYTLIRRRDVDDLQPIGITDQVIDQDCRSLKPCVCPSAAVRIGNVEAGDGNGLNLVGRFWDLPLDRLLVLLGQN